MRCSVVSSLALCVLWPGVVTASRAKPPRAKPPPATSAPAPRPEIFSFSQVLAPPVTLAEARAIHRSLENPAPDDRFRIGLLSLNFLRELEPMFMNPVPTKSGWRFDVISGRTSSTICEIGTQPSYSEMLDKLVERAKALFPELKPSDVPADGEPLLFDDEADQERLRLRTAWKNGDRSAAVLQRALHVAVSDSFEMRDVLGLGDGVPGSAWGLLALARSVGAGSKRDEVLLLSAMGYEHEAREAARALPIEDPVRAFVRNDDVRLKRLAEAQGASPAVRYLWIRLLLKSASTDTMQALPEYELVRNSPTWSALFRQHNSLEFDSDAFRTIFQIFQRNNARLPVKDRVPTNSRALNGQALLVYQELERKLFTSWDGLFPGPYDHSLRAATLGSALQDNFDFHVYDRGLNKEGEEFLRWLGKPQEKDSETIAIYELLEARLTLARTYQYSVFETLLSRHRYAVGAEALASVASRAADSSEPDNWVMRDMVRWALFRLDARPAHLLLRMNFLEDYFADTEQAARIARRWAPLVDDRVQVARLELRQGNPAPTLALLDDTSAPAEFRYRAIRNLLGAGVWSADQASPKLKALVSTAGDERLILRYIGWLDDESRWDELIQFGQGWLRAHQGDTSLGAAEVRVDLADALRHTGHPDLALQLLGPAVETGKASALYENALSLLATGKEEEAREQAREAHERYSVETGSSAEAIYAGFLWRAGSVTEAAEVLRGKTGTGGWRWAGPQLTNAFRGRPEAEALRALEKAIDGVAPAQLAVLISGFEMYPEAGKYAAYVADRLGQGSLDDDLQIYLSLRRQIGFAKARDWFLKHHKIDAPEELSAALFAQGAEELMPDIPVSAKDTDVLWLRRAVTLVRRHVKTGPERDQIEAWFRKPAEKDSEHLHELGRMLLGLVPRQKVLDMPGDTDDLQRTAFYVGVAAEAAGQYEEAADWFQEAGWFRPARAEVDWAGHRLLSWRAPYKSLRRIAEEQARATTP